MCNIKKVGFRCVKWKKIYTYWCGCSKVVNSREEACKKKKLPSQYFTHLLPRGILQSSTMRGKYMIS